MNDTNRRNSAFWISSLIILATTIVSIATHQRWFNLRFQIGPYYFTHWLSWIGTLFIAIYTPIYYTLKRRNPSQLKTLIKIHVYGNLLSVMFISIHYAQQVGRPAAFYPDLGTGLALYIVMVTLVITGFLHRFNILNKQGNISRALPHQNRYVHLAITLTFYLVITIHILKNIGLI